MEENINTQNDTVPKPINTEVEAVNNIDTQNVASPHSNLPTKVKAVIILAIITLIVLTVFYFLGKKEPVVQISDEEKINQINEVVRQTKEQGLPSYEDQLSIIRSNAQ